MHSHFSMMLSNAPCSLLLVYSHTTAYRTFQDQSRPLLIPLSIHNLTTHLHTIYFGSRFEPVLKNLLPRRTCTQTCWFSPAVRGLNLGSGPNFGNPKMSR